MFSQETKDYAEALHRLTCHHNHTDQCGWFYDENARVYDYEDAEEKVPQLKERNITPKMLHEIADIIRPHTKEWL